MTETTGARRARGGKAAAAADPPAPLTMPDAKARAAVAEAMPLDLLLAAMRFHFARAQAELDKGRRGDGAGAAEALDRAAEFARAAAPFVHAKGKSEAGTEREDLIVEVVNYADALARQEG